MRRGWGRWTGREQGRRPRLIGDGTRNGVDERGDRGEREVEAARRGTVHHDISVSRHARPLNDSSWVGDEHLAANGRNVGDSMTWNVSTGCNAIGYGEESNWLWRGRGNH